MIGVVSYDLLYDEDAMSTWCCWWKNESCEHYICESDAERWVAISVSISCEYVELVGFVELLSSSPD